MKEMTIMVVITTKLTLILSLTTALVCKARERVILFFYYYNFFLYNNFPSFSWETNGVVKSEGNKCLYVRFWMLLNVRTCIDDSVLWSKIFLGDQKI